MNRMDNADRLRWILGLVEESLVQPGLRGDDLAARAYLSRFHFDRLAAAALGEPPGAFRRRLDVAGPRFRDVVLTPIRDGRAEETFLDAMCDPPQAFTYGGVLAHVLTFAAARRTMAIGALESAGITDLGSGDPMHFVGGSGSDASTIKRRQRLQGG
jgi:hypothetical protein